MFLESVVDGIFGKIGMALRDFSIYLSLTFRHEMSLLFFFDGFLCLVSSDGLASF